ncbi:hypothetical protein RN001_002446 [Aquatica leii]|uniref:MADF domain-containing protein n=1 Tax=Aquatica leii TaxID=1421715 RepID=A0AAN7QB43_9COLE|nr:hypothetical protein RN001_002446 [Aquatica leii]
MSWKKEEVLKLIDLYQNHQVLWVVKDPRYHNKNARHQALEAIVNELKELRPSTTVNEVKTKFNSLRTQFNKEVAKLRSIPSGAGAEVVKINMWCFKDMLFLQDQSVARSSFSNLPQQAGCSSWAETIEINEEEVDTSNTENSNGSTKNNGIYNKGLTHKKRKVDSDNVAMPVLNKITSAIESITSAKEDEPWEVFSKFVSTELQGINNPLLRTKCKREILRTIMNYQEEDEN